MKITENEKGLIAIKRLNELERKREVIKNWNIGRLEITFRWRSKTNMWGRFSGGWNWKLGWQASRRTSIFNLLVFSLRFHLREKQ